MFNIIDRRIIALDQRGNLMVKPMWRQLLIAAIVAVSTGAVLAADEPTPAIRDTTARAKSKNATLTTQIVPSEAKAGETVKLVVKAKMLEGFHIFKYTKEKSEPGQPVTTTFDIFDLGGLKVAGEWKSSKEPTKLHMDVFPDIKFIELFEDEVDFSIDLLVPAGTEPGKKSVRVQAGYQICNDKFCSQPGQWTLPAVELTVLPGGAVVAEAPKAAPAEVSIAATPPVAKAAEVEKPKAPINDVEKSLQGGIIPFLLLSAGGGLLALVMPCVWPMVPVTVNFFVKQGQKKNGKTKGLAFAYCFSIIGIFTLVGLLFSVFFGAASLSKLANNPWLNFAVAGLFIAFGLSLLGLFELTLPNFLLNASVQGEGKGGMIGVMFMALTLTITSFTCTFPVVGGLLVMAAGGQYFYPIIGLATFASVIAFPFLLLALAPGLLAKVPKSGDWMNAVKVVGGLVEIGAAFKFLNTAECAFVVPEDAWFNAPVVLSIWVVLTMICGIYLLGLFRTDHDHNAVQVGAGRIVMGAVFLSLALYLAPALFGRPPHGKIWYTLVGLLPADAAKLAASTGGGGAEKSTEVRASSTDPKVAEKEKTSFHGVTWGFSYEAALEKAKNTGKPVLIDFTGVSCANCRLMEAEVLPRQDVVSFLEQFVTVQLYTDFVPLESITREEREALGRTNLDRELDLTNDSANPFYVVLSPTGEVLGSLGGYRPAPVFIDFLKTSLEKHQGGRKVAQAAGN